MKDCKTRWEMVEALRQDIRDFKEKNGCSRIVVAWAASTEIYVFFTGRYGNPRLIGSSRGCDEG